MNLGEQTKIIQSFINTHHEIGKLPEKEVSDFYIQLIDCLVDHNHQYYIQAKPIISDKEYDELFDYLKKIEEHFPQLITSNSPTQGLIGQVSEGFVQAKHETKLLSLENTYNATDIQEWNERIQKILAKENENRPILYSLEPKFDGLSVELIYKNGQLIQAITRGDGWIGDDITENVKTIKNLPKKISFPGVEHSKIHVRGEILMPKSIRKEINKERTDNGETPFANTRNAAAGSIKLLDPKEVAKRGLVCYIYDILMASGIKNMSSGAKSKDIINITDVGLPIFPRKKTHVPIEEIIKLCEDPTTKKYLEDQDIEFDGLVVKVEDTVQRKMIGSTDHHPRRAVAYKFPAQLVATKITSIDFQVGRTGIITPVANLEPVQLSGATLKRVSLHNFDFIKQKDIHLHDWIRLQRSGEVIPYIVSVITERREGSEIQITPPMICPSCQQKLTQQDIHYYCENPHCTEKVKQQIQHFVSKNCMDIQGIGESTVDILVDQKIISTIADIYTLTDIAHQIQLRKFPGIGDKKVAEMIKGIEDSKKKPLRRLLNGIGIPHVGKKMAQDLVSQMNNEKGIMNNLTDTERLGSIYGIGEKSIEAITTFFSDTKNIHLLEQLKKYGVNMNPMRYNDFVTIGDSKGTFSITGSFIIPREKITELFQQQGYLFHESPTKTTDFILIGDKAGSKKNKAEELGITIYESREQILQSFPFLKKLDQESNKPKIQSLF